MDSKWRQFLEQLERLTLEHLDCDNCNDPHVRGPREKEHWYVSPAPCNHWTIVLARKKVLDTLIEGLLEDLLDDLWKDLREDLQILPDGFCSTLSLRAYQRDVTVWLSTIRAPRRIVQLHLVHTWSNPPWKRMWKRTWKRTWPHCLGRAAGSAGYRETAKRHDISRMCLAFWEVRTCTFLRLKQFGTTRLLAFLI